MWKCKKCGSENIEVEVTIEPVHTYFVGKDGKPSTLSSWRYDSLDEVVRDDGEVEYYYCDDCGNSSEDNVKDIADWEEE